MSDLNGFTTHTVFNQSGTCKHNNSFTEDDLLTYWVAQFTNNEWDRELHQYGSFCALDLIPLAENINHYLPEFSSHNRFGERVDEVKFHCDYHRIMARAIEANIHSHPWVANRDHAHTARAALEFMHIQAEAGTACPLTMTFASVPAIQQSPSVAKVWLPLITSNIYDGSNKPYFEKKGVTIGMAMTEKQGGSDVRANTSRAAPITKKGNGEAYLITGHKWFCSAPMSDAFLTLAHTGNGLSCFLMPRWRPDGTKNTIHIQRLKDKLGNQSNASSEIEFYQAFGWLLGEEGKGVNTIIEMVSLTRFDCMVGSSALVRSALNQAIHHTHKREAFGKRLIEQPLMLNVVSDLALESEAMLAFSMRVAHAIDNSVTCSREAAFSRLTTAIGKYWICKRAPHLIYEAMECLGGTGYIEENILPRLYREAPVNAIWEGSGNIQCLDIVRVILKEPLALNCVIEEISSAAIQYDPLHKIKDCILDLTSKPSHLEANARYLADLLALALQASTLIIHGPKWISDAYCGRFLNSRVTINSGAHGKYHAATSSAIIQRAKLKSAIQLPQSLFEANK